MTDNTSVLNPLSVGTAGDVIRTIDVSGVKTQVVALGTVNAAGTVDLVSSTTFGGGSKSTLNSSTALLAGGATFTGLAESNGSVDLMLSCKSDQDGTVYFDFSNDGGSTWPSTLSFVTLANTHEFHVLLKGPRTYRVRYVNGAAAQGTFDLSVYNGTFRQPNSPLSSTIASDADALIVRSVSSELDLALGRFGGLSEDTKFGGVEGLDAADAACDVWAFANDALATRSNTKTFPTSAATLYIASDSAADTSKTFTVTYLTSTGAEATAVVTTNAANGQTPVSLGVDGLDVSRIRLTGDTQTHAGNIYVQQGNGFTAGVPNVVSAVLGFVVAGRGQSQQCLFTVPSGVVRHLKHITILVARTSGAAGSAEVHLLVKPPSQSWNVRRDWHLTTAGVFDVPLAGLVLTAGTQCVVRVFDVSDADTNVTAEIQYDDAAV